MSRGFTSIAVILLVGNLNGQSSDFYYTYFGGAGQDIANSIIECKNGDYLVAGSSVSFPADQTDVYLTRTASNHSPIWSKIYTQPGIDFAKSVLELPDSSIVMVGTANSFDVQGYDILVQKVDKHGVTVWRKTFGGTDWDFGNCALLAPDSNVIICGSTFSYGRGMDDAIIMKLNTAGTVLWSKTYGGVDSDVFSQVITTADQNLMAIGTTKSYGDKKGDIWLCKLTSTGDSIWFKTFGDTNTETGKCLIQDMDANFILGGSRDSINPGKSDAYLIKTTSNGSFIWQRYYGLAQQSEEIHAIKNSTSTFGRFIVCFSANEIAAFKIDAKPHLLDYFGYYVEGGRVGSYENDEVFSITNCKDKGFALAGYTQSFDAQQKDIFIIKFDSLVHGTGSLAVSSGEIRTVGSEIEVYPIPFGKKITIVRPDEKACLIRISDLSGRILYSNATNNLQTIILDDISLSSGLYVLTIESSGCFFKQKINCINTE
jgi:hypothetical protein